mmetsp:Transcript_30942/g.30422  ORF Transcript_30942/g.30422 Transcript_30942/m.30422 type:complete len:112 (+) Transcript_30942:412-747(+)
MITGDIPLSKIMNHYREVNRMNVLKLLLRCKNMYEVRWNVQRIIKLIISKEFMYPQVQRLMTKERGEALSKGDLHCFEHFLSILSKIKRELNCMKQEFKMFKGKFIFKDQD